MLEDSRPVALLTQKHLEELFEGYRDALPMIDLDEEVAEQTGEHLTVYPLV